MPALGTLFLALAALTLLLGVYALWQSLRAAFGVDTAPWGEVRVGGEGRAALVDEKRAILSNLKDLEHERQLGKISDQDFSKFDAEYRARARQILRILDEELAPYRDAARRLLDARAPAAEGDGPRAATEQADAALAASASARAARRTCTACAVENDGDAVFCKKCGARLDVVAAPASREGE